MMDCGTINETVMDVLVPTFDWDFSDADEYMDAEEDVLDLEFDLSDADDYIAVEEEGLDFAFDLSDADEYWND